MGVETSPSFKGGGEVRTVLGENGRENSRSEWSENTIAMKELETTNQQRAADKE